MADHNDAPTATEFVPAEFVPANRTDEPMIRKLQATEDGGVEVAAHESYDDIVNGRTYVCDQCGDEEGTERGIAEHLEEQH